jgi:HAD superfamily phosphoserine phosphatase-like hydrolase
MISVVIPALNEAKNIEYVIHLAVSSGTAGEVIVVDDGSIDETREFSQRAGAQVVTSSLLGKGASMDDGLRAASGEVIVYLDGDLRGIDPELITKLVNPIVRDEADFIKARFSRSAGRVTTLTAKPLLETFFPELANINQPLGGIIAVRRRLLERLSFETDYGVDLALLIDAHFAGARIAEVDIGHLEHDSQTLDALGEMAKQVVRVLLHRAEKHGRLTFSQIQEVEEVERQANAEFDLVLDRMGRVEKLALFDMDGTLLRDRSVVALAARTGRLDALQQYLDNPAYSTEERTRRIAECLRGIPRSEFVELARSLELSPGAAETVIALRRLGYRVGVVSDSFRIVTEIVRRRVFADFSIANLLRFRDGLASGEISLAPIFRHQEGCAEHEICKSNALMHVEEKMGVRPANVLAVGDSANDLCLLRRAGCGIAYEPKTRSLEDVAQRVIQGDMRQILDVVAMPTDGLGWHRQSKAGSDMPDSMHPAWRAREAQC